MKDSEKCEIIRDNIGVPDHMYKVIIVGEASVGKSCLLTRAIENKYDDDYMVTIGADSSTLLVKIGTSLVQLQIWDTAGTEKYRSMIRVFFAGADAALLTYDITKKESFESLEYCWLDLVRQSTSANVKIVVVGNKKDLEASRQVDISKAEELVKSNDLFTFTETSAKTGEGILEIFMKLAKVLLKECSDKVTHDGIKLGDETNDNESKEGCC